MQTLESLDLSIISLIILIFIYFNAYDRYEKVLISYKLFIRLVLINILLLIVDIFGWQFNRLPGMVNLVLNTGFNAALYILAPIAPMLWILYITFQVSRDEKKINLIKKVFWTLIAINSAVSVLSIRTGWYFFVDSNNVYSRGSYFLIYVLFCYALIIYSFIYILINRKLIEKKYYFTLLLFFLPQSIGTTIQVYHYGVSYNWVGMMLSLLIIYFNIQDRSLNTDYLTGAYNRRQLDSYISQKIRNCTGDKSFSAIFIDLNKFKDINDEFGHSMGDEALKDTVSILKNCLDRNDFIARLGGDEFYIILDVDDYDLLEQKVSAIKNNVEKFNQSGIKPYKISFAIGYDVYDPSTNMSPDDFFRHIDILMYNNKKSVSAKV